MSIGNIKGDRDSGETNRDGVVQLGPIGMSATNGGTIGVAADGYTCMTLNDVRVADGSLQPGQNVVALRLYELDTDATESHRPDAPASTVSRKITCMYDGAAAQVARETARHSSCHVVGRAGNRPVHSTA